MSSRAAYAQSFDPYYAATKGALESFINSLSRHLKPAQSLVSVRAGLIRESRMFFEMPADVRLKHMEISGNSLIDLNLACEEIWKLDPKMTLKHNGEVVYVGPKY
jgi:short-subunit dehydrogenase